MQALRPAAYARPLSALSAGAAPRRHRFSPGSSRFINPLRNGVAARGPPSPPVLDHISMQHGLLAAEMELERHANSVAGMRAAGMARAPPLSPRDVDPPHDHPAHRLPRALSSVSVPRMRRRRRMRGGARIDGREVPSPACAAQAWFPGSYFLIERATEDKEPLRAYFHGAAVVGVDVEASPTLCAGGAPLPTALLSMAVDQCALLYSVPRLGGAPLRAARLLADPDTIKVVWDVERVLPRLTGELGLELRSVVDLKAAARRAGLPRGDTRELCADLLSLHVPAQLKSAQWEAWPLTETQAAGAARNAWLLRELLLALPDEPVQPADYSAVDVPGVETGAVAVPWFSQRQLPHLRLPALPQGTRARAVPAPRVGSGGPSAPSVDEWAARWLEGLHRILLRSLKAARGAGMRVSVVADDSSSGDSGSGVEPRAAVLAALRTMAASKRRLPAHPRLRDARRVLWAMGREQGGRGPTASTATHSAVPSLHPPWQQTLPFRANQWEEPSAVTASRLGSRVRSECEVTALGWTARVWGAPGSHLAQHCAHGALLLALLEAEANEEGNSAPVTE